MWTIYSIQKVNFHEHQNYFQQGKIVMHLCIIYQLQNILTDLVFLYF